MREGAEERQERGQGGRGLLLMRPRRRGGPGHRGGGIAARGGDGEERDGGEIAKTPMSTFYFSIF